MQRELVSHLWSAPHVMKIHHEHSGEVVAPHRPRQDGDGWELVDFVLLRAVEQVRSQTGLIIALLLTNMETERAASVHYVFFEPMVDIVIAINPARADKTTISATDYLWDADTLGPTFAELTDFSNHQLQQQPLEDALISIAERASELWVEPPRPPQD
jgi:hypothetical protein